MIQHLLTQPINLLIYSASFALFASTVLALVDPSFRPTFGEIIKSLISGVVQALLAKK